MKGMMLRSGFVKVYPINFFKEEQEQKEILELKLLILILKKALEVCDISKTHINKVIDIGISRIVIPDGIDIEDLRISAMKKLPSFIAR